MPGRSNYKMNYWAHAGRAFSQINTRTLYLLYSRSSMCLSAGRPVIKRLNELNVPEQSRVWWCPTSVFCSLPLHAMGPIPSEVGRPRYFLDLYIPSYIPSLSALIESRKPRSQAIGKPSILLVVQPDEEMLEALKEMKAVRAVNTQVTRLFSVNATPT